MSPYSDRFGGCVLNATINLYSYCTLTPASDGFIRFRASDRGEEYSAAAVEQLPLDGELTLHKAVYNRIVRQFNNSKPLPCELITFSDAPAGSGLGTSSTMVVAILGAFASWLNLPLGEYEIAHLAYEIERIELGLAGGKQDQYAAAFGGFNFIEFHQDNHVIVNPLRVRTSIINELQCSLLLYYTGVSRDSATIISEQMRNVATNLTVSVEAMHALKEDTTRMKEHLLKGDLLAFATVLGHSWLAKKMMSSVITNPQIDNAFQTAIAAGARSGKVSGAGGGGFIMFMIDPSRREEVNRALSRLPGTTRTIQFTPRGVETWTTR